MLYNPMKGSVLRSNSIFQSHTNGLLDTLTDNTCTKSCKLTPNAHIRSLVDRGQVIRKSAIGVIAKSYLI